MITLDLDTFGTRLDDAIDAFAACLGKDFGAWLLRMPPPLLGQPCPRERPCRYYQCRHHLAVEWTLGGMPRLVHPDERLADMRHTCVWDAVADHPAGMSLDQVSQRIGVSLARTQQIQETAKIKVQRRMRGIIRNPFDPLDRSAI
jgi:hypothetical protein